MGYSPQHCKESDMTEATEHIGRRVQLNHFAVCLKLHHIVNQLFFNIKKFKKPQSDDVRGLGNEDSGRSENGVLALLFWPFLGSCRSSEAFAPSLLAGDSSDPSSALPAAIEGRPALKCHVSEPPVYDSQPGIQVCFRRTREHNVCTIQE